MSINRKYVRSSLGYLLGFSILGLILYFGGRQSIELAVTPIPSFLLLSFLSELAIFITTSIRWRYLINQMAGGKVVVNLFHCFTCLVCGRFLGHYVSQLGGDLVRPGLLRYVGGVPIKNSLSAILLERVFDLILIVTMLIPCTLYLFGFLTGLETSMIIALIIILILFVVIRNTEWFINLVILTLKNLYTFFTKILPFRSFKKDSYMQQISGIRSMLLLKPRALLNTAALTMLRHILMVVRIYFLTLALELTIPAPILIVGLPITHLSLIFAFTPGAVGFLEAGWYAVLAVAQVPEIERSAFLLAQRVFLSVFIGVIFLVTYAIFGANRTNLLRRSSQAGRDER
jgi:uncharacterized protein (TIRG00374 family)